MSKEEFNLQNVVYKDTTPFVPPITGGKVIKVYDGDTITIASKLPFQESPLYRFSVRILGIDCPEMRTKNATEKECAKLAKKKIVEMAMGKIVELKNVQLEKYGRILADVFCDGVSLGDSLCECNLAVKYDGGTKHVPEDWMVYHTSAETVTTTI